nr:hypothetical protein [Tanacetum cinerariifolium]
MYPSDFEDLNLLLLQGHLDHLSGSDKRWDVKGFEFKHDYTIIEFLRAVVFPVNNNERKIMKFNNVQNQRDLPRDNPLVSIEVLRYDIKRSKCKNKGIVPTETEIELEQTQQGSSHEVLNIRVIPKYHSKDGNPARANIKQALGRSNTYTRNPVKEILLKIEST